MFRSRAKIVPLDLSKKRKNRSIGASPSSTTTDTRGNDSASPDRELPQESPLATRLSSASQRALKLILHKSTVYRVSQINGEPSPIFLTKEIPPTYDKDKILPPTPDDHPSSDVSNNTDFPLPLTFGDLETWHPEFNFYHEDDDDNEDLSSMVFTVGVDLDDEEPKFILIHQKQKSPPQNQTTPIDTGPLNETEEDEFPFEFVLTRSPSRWGKGEEEEEGEGQAERPASPRTPLRPNMESKRQNRSGGVFKLSPVDGSFVQVTESESLE